MLTNFTFIVSINILHLFTLCVLSLSQVCTHWLTTDCIKLPRFQSICTDKYRKRMKWMFNSFKSTPGQLNESKPQFAKGRTSHCIYTREISFLISDSCGYFGTGGSMRIGSLVVHLWSHLAYSPPPPLLHFSCVVFISGWGSGVATWFPLLGLLAEEPTLSRGPFFGPFPLCRMPLDVIKLIFDLRFSNGKHVIVYRPSAVHDHPPPPSADSGLNAPNHESDQWYV